MDSKLIKIIQKYQCAGCTCGNDIKCFKPNTCGGVGCGNHSAGTFISNGSILYKIILGMPKGFDRVGQDHLIPVIYQKFDDSDWKYDMFNVPVWKYLTEEGYTLVRGLMPRRNETFLHVFLEDCRAKINCLEVTKKDIGSMD